jgi:NADH dehydrogenase (ubiquinone) 1 beta subcomplex subunit 8
MNLLRGQLVFSTDWIRLLDAFQTDSRRSLALEPACPSGSVPRLSLPSPIALTSRFGGPRNGLYYVHLVSMFCQLTFHQNGRYPNPPAQKRQFRDPYGGWWDKQDRRNFGEPVHEDNDILATFSTEPYTHFTPQKGFFLVGCTVSAFALLVGALSLVVYSERPCVPRTFPDGLEKELGGPNAVPVS